MKKNKTNRGFTLIELLAVILILGLIALIGIPRVTGIIEEAREKTNVENVYIHIKNINKSLRVNAIDRRTLDGTYTFEELGFEEFPSEDTTRCVSYSIKDNLVKEATTCLINNRSYAYSNDEVVSSNYYTKSLNEYILLDNNDTKDIVIPADELVNKLNTESSERYQNGLFKTTDYDGTITRYFRGKVNNNYLKIGNDLWRIIRINGDGTIRIIKDHNVTVNNADKFQFHYNTKEMIYTYFSNSTLVTALNNWYNSNVAYEPIYKNIVTSGYYCQEAKVKNGSAHTSENATMETIALYVPTLSCNNSDGNITNGVLYRNSGLITIDEVLLAGGKSALSNTKFYLHSGETFWTMSSAGFNGQASLAWRVFDDGAIYQNKVNYSYGLRPVLNIKKDVNVVKTYDKNEDIYIYVVEE